MTEFVVGETAFIDESLSDYEALRVFFDVADERRHVAPSVMIDADDNVLTHRDYSDDLGDTNVSAGVWAFCRRPLPEALGAVEGTGWVRQVAPHLLLNDVPYPMEPFFRPQPYVQRFGSGNPIMLPPVHSAVGLAVAPGDARVCVLDERSLGNGHVLWEYELGLGTRRLVATFPVGSDMSFTELSYSRDGHWLLLCGSGRCRLVQVSDGLTIRLPVRAEAAAWNPRNGPNALILMVTDRQSGSVVVQDYDLSTNKATHRSTLRPQRGVPLDVRELRLNIDEQALVVAPVGATGFDQAARGGVWSVAIVDLGRATIDPVLPSSFKAPLAGRRHRSPRWCDGPLPFVGLTAPAASLLETGSVTRDTGISDPVTEWSAVLSSIVRAWRTGAAPVGTLAQELIQYAIACGDLAAHTLDRLESLSRHHATADAVRRRIEQGRRLWEPIPADAPAPIDVTLPDIPRSVTKLITAATMADATAAAQELLVAVSGEPWAWLAEQSARGLRTGDYRATALIALCVYRWNVHHVANTWSLRSHRLGTPPPDLAVTLYLNGFEAATHLPEQAELTRVEGALVDAESVRQACLRQLHRLGYAPHLGERKHHRKRRGEPTVVMQPQFNRGTDRFVGKAFISYQRADLPLVEPIVTRLKAAHIDCWIDINDLVYGGVWPQEIKRAIRSGGAFVPFFSPRHDSQRASFMNEELRQAIEQARLMHIDRRWLIPVKLEPCEIPAMTIDATTDLTSLHYIDFTTDWSAAMNALIKTLRAVLRPSGPDQEGGRHEQQ